MNQNNIKPQELRATDLRIGNWVIDSLYGSEIKVTIGVLESIHNGNEYFPILLSEEVLKQNGFKPTEDNAGLTLWSNDEDNYWSITWHRNNLVSISSTLRGSGFSGLTLTNVEYFHELQNAIYLATKKDWELSWT